MYFLIKNFNKIISCFTILFKATQFKLFIWKAIFGWILFEIKEKKIILIAFIVIQCFNCLNTISERLHNSYIYKTFKIIHSDVYYKNIAAVHIYKIGTLRTISYCILNLI